MNIPPDLVAAADQRVAAATDLLNHLTNPDTWPNHHPDDTLAVITLAHALQHTINTGDGITTLLAVAIHRLILQSPGNGSAGE